MLLPSQLRADLQAVLAELAAAGLPLQAEVFDAIWAWRFPLLLDWHDPASGAALEVRQALEPWPLICDTPREGGFTSRFVDGSMRRVELIANPALRERWQVRLQGGALPLGAEPLAVRWREQRLYPCLHPGLAPEGPLVLELEPFATSPNTPTPIRRWQLQPGATGFEPLSPEPPHQAPQSGPAWPRAAGYTLDLRLAQMGDPDC
jgi:uncharacterized protein (DUF2126 family)